MILTTILADQRDHADGTPLGCVYAHDPCPDAVRRVTSVPELAAECSLREALSAWSRDLGISGYHRRFVPVHVALERVSERDGEFIGTIRIGTGEGDLDRADDRPAAQLEAEAVPKAIRIPQQGMIGVHPACVA